MNPINVDGYHTPPVNEDIEGIKVDVRTDQEKRDSLNVGLLKHPAIQKFLTWQSAIPHTGQCLRHRHKVEVSLSEKSGQIPRVATTTSA